MVSASLRVARTLLLAMLLPAAVLASAQAAESSAPVRDPYFGMHIHKADKGTPWPKPAFGAWRLWDAGVDWASLEPARGKFDFSRLDRYVAFAERFGIDVLLPLGMTPAWASARPAEKANYRAGSAAEPANIEDWRSFVRTVALRYKGRIRHYDVWNEVNEKLFYSGSTEKLVELTCEAFRIVHEVSPENRLVSPSMIGAGKEPELFEAFLKAGGRNCVDIVGYHFYVPHREPEEIQQLVRRVQGVMNRQGIGKLPLWNTESGWWFANGDGSPEAGADPRWRRVTLEEGAEVVARTLIVGRSAGLERFYWYAWDNGIMGLVEPSSGQMKPAGEAFGVVVRWLQQSRPDCQESMGVWLCELPVREGEIRRIAWRTGGAPRSYRLPAGERLLAVETLTGGRIPAEEDQKAVALTTGPVLVISVSR